MTTVLVAIGVVFAAGIALAVTFGPLFRASTDLDMGRSGWLLTWTWTLTCVGVITGLIVLYVQAHPDHGPSDCADRGGTWSVVGHHNVLVGKVLTTVTDYGCVMPR